MSALFETVKDREGESISDMLLKFGVTHQPGSNGRRYLYAGGECIGLADAQEAVNLLSLLVMVKASLLGEVA